MRKNPKTIKFAKLASTNSNTCNGDFCEKGIFSHVLRLCGEKEFGYLTAQALRTLRANPIKLSS